MKICDKCGNEHNKPGVFCSRSCANSHVQTELQNASRRKKMKGRNSEVKNHYTVPRIENKCETCDFIFETRISEKKRFCCRSCNPNMGGYREKSGRSKSGYFKGMYSGSTYELAWMIYQIDHDIPFGRFDKKLTLNDVSYIPDFIQFGKIVEIKGYEDDRVQSKIEVARWHGYDVLLLKKDDLKKEFEWVRTKYGVKNIYELYDGYKPKYSYVCGFCKIDFSSDKKKSGNVFCSRSCSGKRLKRLDTKI